MARLPRLLLLGLAPLPLAGATRLAPKPALLINSSASEPPGLYVARHRPLARGERIAFRIPEPGRAYAARHMPERLRSSILKTIIASDGDQVCAAQGRLIVNGRDLGPIWPHDRLGRPLPQWRECRALHRGEFFVFSARIPNSFDSRYYGPVLASDVIGVYRPLRVFSGASGGEGGA